MKSPLADRMVPAKDQVRDLKVAQPSFRCKTRQVSIADPVHDVVGGEGVIIPITEVFEVGKQATKPKCRIASKLVIGVAAKSIPFAVVKVVPKIHVRETRREVCSS